MLVVLTHVDTEVSNSLEVFRHCVTLYHVSCVNTCRHCEVSNSLDLVRVFERLCKDVLHRVHNASLLHSAAR